MRWRVRQALLQAQGCRRRWVRARPHRGVVRVPQRLIIQSPLSRCVNVRGRHHPLLSIATLAYSAVRTIHMTSPSESSVRRERSSNRRHSFASSVENAFAFASCAFVTLAACDSKNSSRIALSSTSSRFDAPIAAVSRPASIVASASDSRPISSPSRARELARASPAHAAAIAHAITHAAATAHARERVRVDGDGARASSWVLTPTRADDDVTVRRARARRRSTSTTTREDSRVRSPTRATSRVARASAEVARARGTGVRRGAETTRIARERADGA